MNRFHADAGGCGKVERTRRALLGTRQRRATDRHPLQQALDLLNHLDERIEAEWDPNPTPERPHRLPIGTARAYRADLFNALRRVLEANPNHYQTFRHTLRSIQSDVSRTETPEPVAGEFAPRFVGDDVASEPEPRQYPSRRRRREERERRDAA